MFEREYLTKENFMDLLREFLVKILSVIVGLVGLWIFTLMAVSFKLGDIIEDLSNTKKD